MAIHHIRCGYMQLPKLEIFLELTPACQHGVERWKLRRWEGDWLARAGTQSELAAQAGRRIETHPDCVDLPILRALVAEHRDILDIMSTTRAPEFLKLSITIEALSTEKLTYRPELAAVRGRTLYAVTCIEETWAEAISDPGNVNLRKLRAAMAGYDNLLCDLETRQRRIMEDATIHVRVVRIRRRA
ncbi:hypothetical protein NW762_012853 [Fusarium torreyae]|uniref:Uncharacterized protein n=1 Tax=Fusarium torreyae TaxID=1237075 RepID=A0A9W8RNA5_9HYPO|nr:hypothetical protein NW762_012853 [Fusarium torreyae]